MLGDRKGALRAYILGLMGAQRGKNKTVEALELGFGLRVEVWQAERVTLS